MVLVSRLATVNDFSTAAELCHSRGDSLNAREAIWESLWDRAHPFGIVLTDYSSRERRDVAVLIGAFIDDQLAALTKSSRVPGAYQRSLTDHSIDHGGFVRPDEVGLSNAGSGLHLYMAHVGWAVKEHGRAPAPSVRAIAWSAFLERHGGNRLQSVLGEATGQEAARIASRAGWAVWNGYERWANQKNVDPGTQPILVGVDREAALQAESPWLVRMFTYFPPRFHFTQHQREILLLAREGLKDQEIANAIGASPEAIKKRWTAIYERVADVFPDMLPAGRAAGRGTEKRRALLSHLRDRPEELRPYCRVSAARPAPGGNRRVSKSGNLSPR
jgi:hypothetical protein